MISPATSGEIFTSVSGCTLPVAETVSMIVRRVAFSVVTRIGCSRLPRNDGADDEEENQPANAEPDVEFAAGFALAANGR